MLERCLMSWYVTRRGMVCNPGGCCNMTTSKYCKMTASGASILGIVTNSVL